MRRKINPLNISKRKNKEDRVSERLEEIRKTEAITTIKKHMHIPDTGIVIRAVRKSNYGTQIDFIVGVGNRYEHSSNYTRPEFTVLTEAFAIACDLQLNYNVISIQYNEDRRVSSADQINLTNYDNMKIQEHHNIEGRISYYLECMITDMLCTILNTSVDEIIFHTSPFNTEEATHITGYAR
ncbi:hypothetical protein [Brucella thiophenivorans]|uniref:hypothetical protein n=2 Tax=Brucella thiophenivorans TaxID=571255 RepID=UPI0035BBAD72